MRNALFLMMICCLSFTVKSQEQDKDLLRIKDRLERIDQFNAELRLELDVPFINMPPKEARMQFRKGEEIDISSSDFVFLPKHGLDFSMSELFKYPFITVDRGVEESDGSSLKVINLIPTTDASPLALATLYLDTLNYRIEKAKINTKKQGSYEITSSYDDQTAILPSYIEVSFAIERLKIPLNFMGRDTNIDRKKMRSMDTKTGMVKMWIDYTDIIIEGVQSILHSKD